MKFNLFILFILTILNSDAQEKKIYIIDALSNLPIDFAYLSINQNVCCSTNGKGEIKFENSKLKIGDTFMISKLGYHTNHLTYKVINSFPDTIFLHPNIIALNEVTFKNEKTVEFKLGNPVSFTINKFLPRVNDAFATYIPTEKEGYIKGINLNLSDALHGIEYPFKLQICEVLGNGKPGSNLLGEDVIINNPRRKSWLKINLSNYNISIPKIGFYVILIVLPEEYYEKEKIYYHKRMLKQLPCFALRAYRKNEKSFTLIRYKSYNGNDWYKLNNSIINFEIIAEAKD